MSEQAQTQAGDVAKKAAERIADLVPFAGGISAAVFRGKFASKAAQIITEAIVGAASCAQAIPRAGLHQPECEYNGCHCEFAAPVEKHDWPNCKETQCEQAHEIFRCVMQVLGINCDDNVYVVGKMIRVNEAITNLQSQLTQAQAVIKETCEDEKAVRDAARPILGEWVDGDSHCVPTVADIAAKLAENFATMQRERDEAVKVLNDDDSSWMKERAQLRLDCDDLRARLEKVEQDCDHALQAVKSMANGAKFASEHNERWQERAEKAEYDLALTLARAEKAEKEAGERLQKMQQLEQQIAAKVARIDFLEVALRGASPIVQRFASENPIFETSYGSTQDPMGAHAWLRNYAAALKGEK